MTQGGGFRASDESGKMANRAPRAPANSLSGRRFPRVFWSVSRMPMCDRSPDSSEMWICWARRAGISFRSWLCWPAGASGAARPPGPT